MKAITQHYGLLILLYWLAIAAVFTVLNSIVNKYLNK